MSRADPRRPTGDFQTVLTTRPAKVRAPSTLAFYLGMTRLQFQALIDVPGTTSMFLSLDGIRRHIWPSMPG